MRSRLLASSLVMLAACESKKETPAPPAAVAPPSTAAAAVAPPPATPPPAAKVDTGFVVYTTVVKKEPSDKPKIDDGKGKQVANWVATLYRGEKVSLIKEDGDYQNVKTSGDLEGWVKKQSLLVAPDVSEATVINATDAFDRPDLLALNSKKKINPGSVIYVVKTKEQFSEVNASGTGLVWVLTGNLTTDTQEVSVAKLLAKARSLKDAKNAQGATDLINLAKNNFGSTKLVAAIETELAKAEEAPASQPVE